MELTLTWLKAMAAGRNVGVYCSDRSGVFDQVSAERLITKLRFHKIHPDVIAVIKSWLRKRSAQTFVGGELSLVDMVFQGTVLGSSSWNLFFEDARRAINEWMFAEIGFADDLNAYKEFQAEVNSDRILENIDTCSRSCTPGGGQTKFPSTHQRRANTC